MKTYLEPEEIALMEKGATNLRDRLLIRLLFRLGCRVTEALALKVEDIDLIQGAVRVLHRKTQLRLSCPHCGARLGRAHAFCAGCGTKVEKAIAQAKEHRRLRILHLDHDTLQMLGDYIHRGGPVPRGGKQPIIDMGIHLHKLDLWLELVSQTLTR